jgi:formate-dependent phosphoribosylglycinamide formyltransferase (GAR transformylase)
MYFKEPKENLILLMGGTVWNAVVGKKLRKSGWMVATVDENAMCESTSYGLLNYNCSIVDKEAMLSLCKKVKPSLIIADSSDRAVRTVGYVNDQLSLPGLSEEVATLFTNKYHMRKKLSGHVAQPNYKLVSVSDAMNDNETRSSLVGKVLKKINGQSSQGIFFISNVDQIAQAFNYYINEKIEYILVEEWIAGREFTVDSITNDGETIITSMSRKDQYSYNQMVSKSLKFDMSKDSEIYKKLQNIHIRTVETLGLKNGLCHGEYKMNQDSLVLIEIAARGGGTGISAIIAPYIMGVDIHSCLVDCMLNSNMKLFEKIKKGKTRRLYASLNFFNFDPGRVKSINYDKSPRQLLWYYLPIKIGQEIQKMNDDVQRNKLGYFIAAAKTKRELEIIEANAYKNSEIVYE